MSPSTRLLLPLLPPELRNEVYRHLSIPDSNTPALTTGLPFHTKTYQCKHTSLQLAPAHHGSPGLLALQHHGFQEGFEYASWLRTYALKMHVGVVFTGRVNTFDTVSWAKKVAAHLAKLAKRYPWLRKVVWYDVRILWDPMDRRLHSRKRSAAQMVREMVDAVTGLLDDEAKRKKGRVEVQLGLGQICAVMNVVSNTKFGLAEFFGEKESNVGGPRREVRSVWRQRGMPAEKEGLPWVVGGVVKWVSEIEDRGLVMRKTWSHGRTVETVVGNVSGTPTIGNSFVMEELIEECLGRR